MIVARIHRFGPPDVIALEDMPIPVPKADEVLVQVGAAGVGQWDGWIRAGHSALPQPLPLTLGSDFSGTVTSVGRDVLHVAPGDQVYGITNARFTGAYAEFAIATGAMIAVKSRRLGFVAAASLPVVAVTASQMLFEHAGLVAGQSVLVCGASGNVGWFAIQLARQHQLHVVACTSFGDAELLREIGAHEVIDLRSGSSVPAVGLVDAVIDTSGGVCQARSVSCLKPGGTLVSSVAKPNQSILDQAGVQGIFFIVDVSTRRLEEITALFDAGLLKTHVGDVLALREARQAHEMLDGLRPRPSGKIILSVNG